MDNSMSEDFQKWLRTCLQKEFGTTVQESLENDEDATDIAHRITQSEEMSAFLKSLKTMVNTKYESSKFARTMASDYRPQSSRSFASDITTDDWNSPRNNDDDYRNIIDKISCDKPVHVRLAGYEILLKSDLSSIHNIPSWDVLQKVLMDGLTDESKPVFEASLHIHAKLLGSLQCHSAYLNLMNAFNAQYHSQKAFELLPSFTSGINFKVFLHERLFRITYSMIQHQGEVLKTVRNIDKATEETIEKFIIFMSTHEFGNSMQPKTLNILNIVSIIEPSADWARKWVRCLGTRKVFLSALAKSPSLLHRIMEYLKKGLDEIPNSITISLFDEPIEVYISGTTIETITYLHSLCFIAHLCAYQAGRTLLSQTTFNTPFSTPEFLMDLLNSLNKLSSECSSSVYNISRYAMKILLDVPEVVNHDDFYHSSLCFLQNKCNIDMRIGPHILDIMLFMLDSADGSTFIISECKEHSTQSEDGITKCPASILISSASSMLQQPFSIINTEYLLSTFAVIEKLFEIYDAYEVVQHNVQKELFPAVKHFYCRLDKCIFENESKAQQINSALSKLLIKAGSFAFGIQALAQEAQTFEELIRTVTTPLRTVWTSAELVNFVTCAAFFRVGSDTLADLAPHILSTLLSETCKSIQDPQHFYDPWHCQAVENLLHILKIFSLNYSCFRAFMNSAGYSSSEEDSCPLNLQELFIESINPESEYHYLGLLSLKTVIWNLDISIYLRETIDYQNVLLELQTRKERETEIVDESNIEDIIGEDECDAEDYNFTKLPPSEINEDATFTSELNTYSELESMLEEKPSGLLDSGWVIQMREAYQASRDPIANKVLVNLVDQMQKAIPTAEWAEDFRWQEGSSYTTDFWFEEDMHGIDLVLWYGQHHSTINKDDQLKTSLQNFISASYAFIKHQKPTKFEGFDWFLSTVFIICSGDINTCKTVLSQLIQFPSTIFLWPSLGTVIDQINQDECITKITFMQLVESIVSSELPNIKFALKSSCGVEWSMICNLLLSQCFWGTLPWSEISRFFAISILYSPDYVIYYCVSLLYHSQKTLLQQLTIGKQWPENMNLSDFHSHNYISYMDTLAKRYGNRILPKIGVKQNEPVTDN